MQDIVKSAITIDRRHAGILAISFVLYREKQPKSTSRYRMCKAVWPEDGPGDKPGAALANPVAYLQKAALTYILNYRH
jgi:hypothetical protein